MQWRVQNIKDSECEVILNAANVSLSHSGGIAAAIEQAAGPELAAVDKQLKA